MATNVGSFGISRSDLEGVFTISWWSASSHQLSSLVALPLYLMSSYYQPAWLILEIDKRRRVFLWKGRRDTISGGLCLVSWDRVCQPKDSGGFRDIGPQSLQYLFASKVVVAVNS